MTSPSLSGFPSTPLNVFGELEHNWGWPMRFTLAGRDLPKVRKSVAAIAPSESASDSSAS